MSGDVCPYCARHPGEGRGATRDHVFVAALGGRARVTACRDCNSTIGHDVEGPLLKPGAFLNLLAQARGGGRPLPGTLDGDHDVTYDLASHELRSGRPVDVTTAGDERRFELRGSPAQVRALLAQQGIHGEQADQLLAAAVPVDTADAWLSTTVTVDLALSARLTAKTALGCGELAFGDGFAASDLGTALRDVLWEHAQPDERLAHNAAGAYDQLLSENGLANNVPTLDAGPGVSQALFLPLPDRRTACLVHLAGAGLPPGGPVMDAPMPSGHGLPVLVRDQSGGALVVDLTLAVARAVASGPPEDTI